MYAVSPPFKVHVGGGADPLFQFFRESEVLDVAITEEHIFEALAFEIVPNASFGVDVPVRVPGPVALDDLGCRPECDARLFDGCTLRGAFRENVAGDVFDAERFTSPFDQITVAPA